MSNGIMPMGVARGGQGRSVAPPWPTEKIIYLHKLIYCLNFPKTVLSFHINRTLRHDKLLDNDLSSSENLPNFFPGMNQRIWRSPQKILFEIIQIFYQRAAILEEACQKSIMELERFMPNI